MTSGSKGEEDEWRMLIGIATRAIRETHINQQDREKTIASVVETVMAAKSKLTEALARYFVEALWF